MNRGPEAATVARRGLHPADAPGAAVACADVDIDPEIFFPSAGTDATAAKQICARCPLREPCAEWAIPLRDLHGVWGGLTAKTRRGIREAQYRARKARKGVVA